MRVNKGGKRKYEYGKINKKRGGSITKERVKGKERERESKRIINTIKYNIIQVKIILN